MKKSTNKKDPVEKIDITQAMQRFIVDYPTDKRDWSFNHYIKLFYYIQFLVFAELGESEAATSAESASSLSKKFRKKLTRRRIKS